MMRNYKYLGSLCLLCFLLLALRVDAEERFNVLFAIADDQSYPHAGAYGRRGFATAAFDRLAREGALFHTAFAAAPQCSPSRAAILTGRNIWQLEEAGTHGSYFPKKYPVFTRRLEAAGYHVGYTGKPWSPGNWSGAGWSRNPVGTEYNAHTLRPPTTEISAIDYTENFRAFLQERSRGQPFFFWYGSFEPHRDYEFGSGARAGKGLEEIETPPFLPNVDLIRNDMLDYALEIEWFDKHLGQMIELLEEVGELDNTLIVVTADNGMPFPHAKASLQEYGTHVPLVILPPRKLNYGAQEISSPVSLIDLAPTFLDFAGLPALPDISGRSLYRTLTEGSEPEREWALTGRERHTHARADNLGYPARAIRSKDFLLILNFKPERWPMGMPPPEDLGEEYLSGQFSCDFKSIGLGYADIDASPSKEFMVESREAYPELFFIAFEKRPSEQLYSIGQDPWCLHNLAHNPNYDIIRKELRVALMEELRKQGDPRALGKGDIFESYPRFGGMRFYPGFKKRGEYNPAFIDESRK